MISFSDPSKSILKYKNLYINAFKKVLNSKRYILGSQCQLLEKEFAAFIGVNYSIGVANGTDGIELVLRALNLGNGCEIITVSHTAVATIAGIEAAGAKPVLVDVNEKTLTIDTTRIEKAINKKTRAVMPVHLYGQSCRLDDLLHICKKFNLLLIEDVSQAHGATWKNRKLGSFGIAGLFSCYPTKNLGAIGDAGLITTNSRQLAEKIKMIREYGWKSRYISFFKGRNSRIDELQAAFLRIKLKKLNSENRKRQKIASFYYKHLKSKLIALPKKEQNSSHVFHLFVVRSPVRKTIISQLQKNNINPGIHYPQPIHLQKAYFKNIKLSGSLDTTEKICREVLSLPMYPDLSKKELLRICKCINRIKV